MKGGEDSSESRQAFKGGGEGCSGVGVVGGVGCVCVFHKKTKGHP